MAFRKVKSRRVFLLKNFCRGGNRSAWCAETWHVRDLEKKKSNPRIWRHRPLRFLTSMLTVTGPSLTQVTMYFASIIYKRKRWRVNYFWQVHYSWCTSIPVRLILVIYFNKSTRTMRSNRWRKKFGGIFYYYLEVLAPRCARYFNVSTYTFQKR